MTNHFGPSVALGLWPIAGITTIGVTQEDAHATIREAIQRGITTFDTAFSYGYEGESDRLLGQYIHSRRDDFRVIGKVGQRWNGQRKRVVNGTPEQLTLDAEESLKRLGIECFDLLMLHSVDPNVPLERSMITICKMHRRGLCRAIGICNVHAAELKEAQRIAELESIRLQAVQCPLNLIQRDSQKELIPSAKQKGIQAHVYWTLMKGLLAGKIHRTHQFAEGDSRPKYDIFQGQQRENAHRIVDELVKLSRELNSNPAKLAVGWTLSQPGVEHALVGARKVEQVIEIAEARPLETATLEEINRITREVLN
ncbi:MAG: aldo/keto reductase [Planctomycetota bacterium]|nr:aldo/keto reductase [Planctomycetota bacterium]